MVTQSKNEQLIKAIDTLLTKRLFFGHMSVGRNITEAIEDITVSLDKPNFKLIRTVDPADFDNPVFGHFKVGVNKLPFSKIDDFVVIMESGLGDKVDLAFFKFCYTDIRLTTDLEKLLSHYVIQFNRLHENYPNTKFVHFTIPVMTRTRGLKGLAKTILDRDHNRSRNRLSEMIRQQYNHTEVFDIEKFETTRADGKQNIYNRSILGLVPEYTYDNGHLNKTGATYIAGELLLFLANQF